MTITDTTVGTAGPGTGASPGTSAASTGTAGPTVRRLIQQQVLPDGSDGDVVSLYVDTEPAAVEVDGDEGGMSRRMRDAVSAAMGSASASAPALHPDQIRSRRSVVVRSGAKLSFGTYFNAFPASYWRRWTVVTDVRLTVALTGAGAAVTVYRSMANGRSQRVDMAGTGADAKGEFTFDLFALGGGDEDEEAPTRSRRGRRGGRSRGGRRDEEDGDDAVEEDKPARGGRGRALGTGPSPAGRRRGRSRRHVRQRGRGGQRLGPRGCR